MLKYNHVLIHNNVPIVLSETFAESLQYLGEATTVKYKGFCLDEQTTTIIGNEAMYLDYSGSSCLVGKFNDEYLTRTSCILQVGRRKFKKILWPSLVIDLEKIMNEIGNLRDILEISCGVLR